MRKLLLTLALCLAAAIPAAAQVQGGTIEGVIQDEQGAVLPGATVTLQGTDRTRTFITESDGRFRFLNLPPGAYKITVDLTGFGTVTREHVPVVVGRTVDLPLTLRVGGVQESITVSGESPIVDTKATGTATNFTQAELENIPTSRDPWALLRTVPGVMVDRVNIAGNETGQQSNFQSKGTRPNDAVWTMDGVVITDMAAIGASPTYFNYDNFEEIQISTSGQDIRQQTGGVGLNFIVKRGTNNLRGGARGYFTSEDLEATNVPDELRERGVTKDSADHNEQISDYGFELGGPIVKDRAWFYASWSSQDIRLVRSAGNFIDRTKLDTTNAKGNWQATSKDMISVLWYLGSKEKEGRSPGDGGILVDAPSATWQQTGVYEEGRPHGLVKIENNRVFSPRFFVSGRYAYYNTGFGLLPTGGLDQQAGQSQRLGRSFGSTRESVNIRPQHTANVESNYFATGLGASHDLKFGGGWRRVDAFTGTLWPGNMILGMDNSDTNKVARIHREGAGTNRVEFYYLYAGNTIAKGPLTLDVGVRWDRQSGEALPSDTRANAAFPDQVPGISFAGYKAPFTWNDFSPRAGLTYALDESRRTVLRASVSRYAGQLDTGLVGYMNPSGTVGFVEYGWNDANGDQFVQPEEVDFSRFIRAAGGFNRNDPTSVRSSNQIDPDLEAPITTSAVAGIDREVAANLGVQVNYSFTRTSGYAGNGTYNPWIGLSAADYAPGQVLTGTLPDATDYAVQTWIPDAALVAANGSGRLLTNWDGYYSQYNGLEVSVVKRHANRWMARVGFALNNATEHYDQDPPRNNQGNPTPLDTEPLVDGGAFVVRSAGSGSGDIFIHGRWQVSANAAYELPRGIQLGASLFGRQGYPYPIYRSVALGSDGTQRVLVSPRLDTLRHDDLWDLDLRVAKSFRFTGANLEVMADLFNVLNANAGLVRNRNIGGDTFGTLAQNLSPRILRFGVKVGF